MRRRLSVAASVVTAVAAIVASAVLMAGMFWVIYVLPLFAFIAVATVYAALSASRPEDAPRPAPALPPAAVAPEGHGGATP